MFIMYFPQLIMAGKVYKAIPPLYSTKIGGKDKCFIDNIELIKYNQKLFSQKYQMTDAKKKSLTTKDLNLFFLRNKDYIYWVDKLANTFGIEQFILEDILNSYVENKCTVNFTKLQKAIKSKYRFMDVYKTNNNICAVKGSNKEGNAIILAEQNINTCKPLIDIIKSNDSLYYYIDGKLMTIYQIMLLYDKCQPANIDRFKGLGETPDRILERFVMNASADRILYQYTIDDLKETMTTIREYESDKKKILSLVDNITREDLAD